VVRDFEAAVERLTGSEKLLDDLEVRVLDGSDQRSGSSVI